MITSALVRATVVGTILQVAMVVSGHSVPAVKALFAVGGMSLSLLAGLLYAIRARSGRKDAAVGGLVAGALCALLGIAVSYFLGDVPVTLLALGTISSAVTGLLGGFIGSLLVKHPGAAAATLIGLLAYSATAHEARAEPTHRDSVSASASPSAPARLADFAWLVGRWEGKVAAVPGGVADVTYTAPRAGTIAGVMRLVQGDSAVILVELISIVETPTGVEMRFRHFSPALDAYEREFKQTMRLTKHDAASDTFENDVAFDSTLMSTQPRRTMLVRQGPDSFVGRSDILGAGGKPAVIESTYRRVR